MSIISVMDTPQRGKDVQAKGAPTVLATIVPEINNTNV
tara:strand:- start:81 stop:194 length:114 start_codon:yes stop_codon:yes gene_type:complete